MNKHFQKLTLKATQASSLFKIKTIQSLWSGYGEIVRYGLTDSSLQTIVVKHIRLPDNSQHPRGWNTDLSHQRKVKSYHIEINWYQDWSHLCDSDCRVPRCLALESGENEMFILLEDMDSSGYPIRHSDVGNIEIKSCLAWLANFHATFMNQQPNNLWSTGTYWHLETRPDELEALNDIPLKNAAQAIDQKLRQAHFQTLVHGDAKLANFCFSKDGSQVAAVDFQYIGGGCGMKDVAYFLGSCLNDVQCQQQESELLDYYFQQLKLSLQRRNKNLPIQDLEQEWRYLYPYAWTDFHRFIKGWSPGHWKINSYSEQLAHTVISQLNE